MIFRYLTILANSCVCVCVGGGGLIRAFQPEKDPVFLRKWKNRMLLVLNALPTLATLFEGQNVHQLRGK